MAHSSFSMFPSSTHSSDNLCGGELQCVVWWRFGQAKMEKGGSFFLIAMGFLNSFSRTAPANSVAVSSGVWCGGGLSKQRWKREGCGGELLFELFLRSLFSMCLERDLSGNLILSTWLASIGWRKILVLRHSLIERFLIFKRVGF